MVDNAKSGDLQWLLVRKWNSKLVKRGAAGFIFSKEHGNLRNIHSYKYSGLVNDKSIFIHPASNGHIHVHHKAHDEHNRRHLHAANSKPKKLRSPSARKAVGHVAKIANGYRDDLHKDAVIRAAALAKAQRAKGKATA